MPKSKTEEIEAFILRLLDKEPEVSIRSIAKALGVSKDDATKRKAIGRALNSLVEQNLIIPKGSGRSRVYIKFDPAQSSESRETVTDPVAEGNPFKGVKLSSESRSLLQYVSQGINERMPVGYVQEFLRSYEPNKTFYLSAEQREKLLEIGRVEAVERSPKSVEIIRFRLQMKSKYGGMEASDLKRMRDLDEENRQLKRMFADLSLENRALKDVLEKKP